MAGGGCAGSVGRIGGVTLGSVGVAFPGLICEGCLEALPGTRGFADPEAGAGRGVAGDADAGAGSAGQGVSEDAGAFEVGMEPSGVGLSSMGALVLFCEEEVSGSSLGEPRTRFATPDVWLGFGGSVTFVEAEEGADLSVQSGIGEAGAGTGTAPGFDAIGKGGGTGFEGGSTSLDLLLGPASRESKAGTGPVPTGAGAGVVAIGTGGGTGPGLVATGEEFPVGKVFEVFHGGASPWRGN